MIYIIWYIIWYIIYYILYVYNHIYLSLSLYIYIYMYNAYIYLCIPKRVYQDIFDILRGPGFFSGEALYRYHEFKQEMGCAWDVWHGKVSYPLVICYITIENWHISSSCFDWSKFVCAKKSGEMPVVFRWHGELCFFIATCGLLQAGYKNASPSQASPDNRAPTRSFTRISVIILVLDGNIKFSHQFRWVKITLQLRNITQYHTISIIFFG